MPAHIIRNMIGFRETEDAGQFVLCPSFGSAFAAAGKRYALEGLSYAGRKLSVSYTFSDAKQLSAGLHLPGQARIVSITRADGQPLKFARKETQWEAAMENHELYRVRIEGFAVS
jgi:hypothetical protein